MASSFDIGENGHADERCKRKLRSQPTSQTLQDTGYVKNEATAATTKFILQPPSTKMSQFFSTKHPNDLNETILQCLAEMEFCDASLQDAFFGGGENFANCFGNKNPSISKEVEDLKYNSHENLVLLILKRSKGHAIC